MADLAVRVVGRPAPQGSHEEGAHGHLLHSSKYLQAWRAAVDRQTRETYVRLGLTRADMPLIPNPLPVWLSILHVVLDEQCRAVGTDEPTGVPDVDKLLRATIDGLGAARVFANDSQVKDVRTGKRRVVGHEPAGAEIIINNEAPWWAEWD